MSPISQEVINAKRKKYARKKKFEDILAGGFIGVIVFFWIIGVLLSLAMSGVIIWAIIVLVNHFT